MRELTYTPDLVGIAGCTSVLRLSSQDSSLSCATSVHPSAHRGLRFPWPDRSRGQVP